MLLLLFSCFSMPLCFAANEEFMLPSGQTAEEVTVAIDEFLNSHKDNHAAVATAVFRGDEDILTRYFGYIDASGSVPLDENCVLEWGSTTKLTVWISAMQLAERGKLDLTADIRTYLPEGFFKYLKYDDSITFINLMNHNAGFQDTDFILEVMNEEDIIPLGTYLARFQPRQVFRPGEVVAYSNWGAALAGYIVERISGMPFYQYAAENIFSPLGMRNTAIAADLSDNDTVREKRSEFVSYLPDGTLAEDTKTFILPYPAGMCTSTPGDFVLFAKALLQRDERLLSVAGYDTLFAPSLVYTETDIPRLCHGFLVDYEFAVPIVGHDGNTAGGSSRLLLDFKNNIGMVVLTNQLGGSLYRTKMAQLVFGEKTYHIPVDDYYMPARTVFEGRHRFFYNFNSIDHFFITSEMADGLFLNMTGDRFELSATDYLSVSPESLRLRDAAAIIWFVLIGYAVLNMLVRIVLAVISACRKLPLDRINLYNIVYSLMLAFSVLPLFIPVPGAVVLVYSVLIVAAGILLGAIMLRKICCKEKLSRLSYWQTASLTLAAIMAIINIFIWDLALI